MDDGPIDFEDDWESDEGMPPLIGGRPVNKRGWGLGSGVPNPSINRSNTLSFAHFAPGPIGAQTRGAH
jgi:hypothetical protein